MNLQTILVNAKRASKHTAQLSSETKNLILKNLAKTLEESTISVLDENKKDIESAKRNNLGEMIDRLLLTEERIHDIANDIRNVASLHDFVGEISEPQNTPNNIIAKKITVPLGVVAMIYESRPNVTIDAAILAFKSGNAIILKGGKEAEYSNKILADIFRAVLKKHDINLENAVQLLENATRQDTAQLLKAKGQIDLLIPRGGKGLIDFVSKNAQVPVIETGASVVHTFVDTSADLEMASKIIINEKTRRTSVCNALDTVLVHNDIAEEYLPRLARELEKAGVKIHLDTKEEVDFSTEWLGMEIAIKKVKDINEALEHIDQYSLGHSESIVTEDKDNAQRFLREVDAACVYHNTSTCFSDGAQFGLGAEIGISTQKLHARGPFALQGLTSYKWIIESEGETRG